MRCAAPRPPSATDPPASPLHLPQCNPRRPALPCRSTPSLAYPPLRYVIPPPVIDHFLLDYKRNATFTGFPALGIHWQRMESDALRCGFPASRLPGAARGLLPGSAPGAGGRSGRRQSQPSAGTLRWGAGPCAAGGGSGRQGPLDAAPPPHSAHPTAPSHHQTTPPLPTQGAHAPPRLPPPCARRPAGRRAAWLPGRRACSSASCSR